VRILTPARRELAHSSRVDRRAVFGRGWSKGTGS
jgi:hypothetical protein